MWVRRVNGMFRKYCYINLIVSALWIAAFLFSKGIITNNFDFYNLTNGQVYRYFIYTMLYVTNYALLSFDMCHEYIYLRIKPQFIKNTIKNFGLAFYINIFATVFGVLYYIIINGASITLVDFIVGIISTIIYQLFVCLIFIVIYIRVKELVTTAGLTFILIWLLNAIVFINIVFLDDLIVILMYPPLLFLIKRGIMQ